MNTPILPLAITLLLSSLAAPRFISAQEAEKEAPKQEQGAPEETTPEEDAEAEKAEAEAEAAKIKSKLAIFKSLEGEWVGEETTDYSAGFPPGKPAKTVKWKDTWKGFYTNNNRYFEMTGKTSGGVESTYHWYVTYDSSNEEYRAWSFGSNGWGEYVGQPTDDGKAVLWSKDREGESVDIADTFELRGKGDKCTASGETRIVSKDGKQSRIYAKQHSQYIRKKIEI